MLYYFKCQCVCGNNWNQKSVNIDLMSVKPLWKITELFLTLIHTSESTDQLFKQAHFSFWKGICCICSNVIILFYHCISVLVLGCTLMLLSLFTFQSFIFLPLLSSPSHPILFTLSLALFLTVSLCGALLIFLGVVEWQRWCDGRASRQVRSEQAVCCTLSQLDATLLRLDR